MYALQVQAFLDAADEVDIDQEIAADILQGFDGDLHGGEFDDDLDIEADNTRTAINAQEDDEEDKDWEGGDDDDDSDLDAFEEEGEIVVILFTY
jgi:NAD-dependent histone deacetylase SIR2